MARGPWFAHGTFSRPGGMFLNPQENVSDGVLHSPQCWAGVFSGLFAHAHAVTSELPTLQLGLSGSHPIYIQVGPLPEKE